MNQRSRSLVILAGSIAAIAVLIGIYIVSGLAATPLVFSPTQVLGATWLGYKQNFIEPSSGRTLDPSRQNITTSEGESYTMLRAVWMGDKQTFDSSWNWTKDNLQHSSDHLFSWLYGQLPSGSYGVLTSQHGNVTAADGDEDIALSLIFAYARWQDPNYLHEAQAIITDIWNKEVVTVKGRPYLVADDLEKTSTATTVTIDPSYLSPAAYRIFALVDAQHPWHDVVDSSYQVLQDSITAALDKSSSANIPPDWISMNRSTGVIGPPTAVPGSTNSTNFGFDALRVPWLLALDYAWYGDTRDTNLLAQMKFLTYTWGSAHAIGETYAHDGSLVDANESHAMYGGALGYFLYEDPANGAHIYQNKLLALYNPDSNSWRETLSYYDDNWAWFGIGLYAHDLPNLAAGVPASAWQ